jgi:hypothetical protein
MTVKAVFSGVRGRPGRTVSARNLECMDEFGREPGVGCHQHPDPGQAVVEVVDVGKPVVGEDQVRRPAFSASRRATCWSNGERSVDTPASRAAAVGLASMPRTRIPLSAKWRSRLPSPLRSRQRASDGRCQAARSAPRPTVARGSWWSWSTSNRGRGALTPRGSAGRNQLE